MELTQANPSAAAAANSSILNSGKSDIFYLLLSKDLLTNTDVGSFIEQSLSENLIPYAYSEKTFPSSILWL